MAPPTVSLGIHKERIKILFLEQNKSVPQIAQKLSEELGAQLRSARFNEDCKNGDSTNKQGRKRPMNCEKI